MGTTTDKLNKLIQTKNNIKSSINNKYGSTPITDSTKFADYPGIIDNIPSGGGSISGEIEQSVVFGESINAGDPIYVTYKNSIDVFNAVTHNALPGVIKECKFSPDGKYLVIATNKTPYITFINLTDMSFSTPLDVIPAGEVNDFCWSPDGNYFVAVGSASPYMWYYGIEDTDTYIRQTISESIPSAGYCCAWSGISDILFIGVNNSPYLVVFNCISGLPVLVDNFFSELPNGAVRGMDLSNDETVLILGLASGAYFIAYDLASQPSNRYTMDKSPGGSIYTVKFLKEWSSSIKSDFILGSVGTPYLFTGQMNISSVITLNLNSINDLFDSANFKDYPTKYVYDIAYNADLNLLAIVQDEFPGVHLYRGINSKLQRLDFPTIPTEAILPNARSYYQMNTCAFSQDGKYFAYGGNGANSGAGYLCIYELKKVALKSNNKALFGQLAYGYAKETKSSGQTGKCGIITKV